MSTAAIIAIVIIVIILISVAVYVWTVDTAVGEGKSIFSHLGL